jgi:hypothetical protein
MVNKNCTVNDNTQEINELAMKLFEIKMVRPLILTDKEMKRLGKDGLGKKFKKYKGIVSPDFIGVFNRPDFLDVCVQKGVKFDGNAYVLEADTSSDCIRKVVYKFTMSKNLNKYDDDTYVDALRAMHYQTNQLRRIDEIVAWVNFIQASIKYRDIVHATDSGASCKPEGAFKECGTGSGKYYALDTDGDSFVVHDEAGMKRALETNGYLAEFGLHDVSEIPVFETADEAMMHIFNVIEENSDLCYFGHILDSQGFYHFVAPIELNKVYLVSVLTEMMLINEAKAAYMQTMGEVR